MDPRTRTQVLRALAARDGNGDPLLSQRQVAERYRLHQRTVQRITRDYLCDTFTGESYGSNRPDPLEGS